MSLANAQTYYDAGDFDKMHEEYTNAFIEGNLKAMYILGYVYMKSAYHVAMMYSDMLESMDDLQKISNSDMAIINKSMYDVITTNVDKMIKCWTIAADVGQSDAAFELGCYYLQNKNYDLAKKYLMIAADNEHRTACAALVNYYLFIEKDNKQADLHMRKARLYFGDPEYESKNDFISYVRNMSNYNTHYSVISNTLEY